MSSKRKGGLSQPTLKDDQVKLTSASTVIQTYMQIILQQPDLKLDALPDLPSHQKTARDHANNWNSTILPLMSQTNADIIDYANKFDSFYEDLVKYANDIKNPDSKAKLVEGLKLLSSTIKKNNGKAEAVVNDLTTFHKNLNADHQNFTKDGNVAALKIQGDIEEIKALSAQLDAIHTAMMNDVSLMVGGDFAIVAGVAMIVVGVVAEIPTAGVSTILIGGGVVVVTGGVTTSVLAGIDYSKQIKAQTKVQEQLAGDKIELLGLKTTMHQVSGFVKGLESAIPAVAALKAAWQALDADLDEVITAVNDVDPTSSGVWLLDELKRAKSDWEDALAQAKRLQPDGKVPIKFYKDLQDAFKEMKSPAEV